MKEKRVTTVKVTSSWAVQDITYDQKSKILTVHMLDTTKGGGKRLNYADVPVSVFNEFIKAESKGGFFNKHVRNTYTFLGE